ncbi:MAG: hypothetical protein HY062_10825 [Bacteroidetes bacterium]|nr:hypothetical protein [Bacteroidota bacterium]
MDKINDYINSGILELYVLGMTSPEETSEVNKMASLHEEVRTEIEEITRALQIDAANTMMPKRCMLKLLAILLK